MTASPISDLNPLLLAAECWITVASHSMFMRVFLVSPHRSTTYAHAAYCYRPSSVVCRSVCLSLCHSREPCKKRLNRSRCRSGCRLELGPRKHVLHGVHIDVTWRIRLNRPYAAAMRPLCPITSVACYHLTVANTGSSLSLNEPFAPTVTV